MRHGHEVLRAGLHPPDRPPEVAGGGDDGGMLGRDPGLAPEPAPDVRGDHPHLAVAVAEHAAQGAGEGVGHLGRHVHRHPVPVVLRTGARAGRDSGDGVTLHGNDGDALVLQAGPHHPVGAGQRIGAGTGHAGDHVGTDRLELQWRSVGHRVQETGRGGQGLVADLHRLGRVESLRLGRRHHQRHRLADEADPVGGKGRAGARFVEHHEPVEGGHSEIGRGQHGYDTGHGLRHRGVHRTKGGMGHRGSDESAAEQPRQAQVGHEGPPPCEQFGVLDPTDAVTENRARHGGKLPRAERPPAQDVVHRAAGAELAAEAQYFLHLPAAPQLRRGQVPPGLRAADAGQRQVTPEG